MLPHGRLKHAKGHLIGTVALLPLFVSMYLQSGPKVQHLRNHCLDLVRRLCKLAVLGLAEPIRVDCMTTASFFINPDDTIAGFDVCIQNNLGLTEAWQQYADKFAVATPSMITLSDLNLFAKYAAL